MITEFTDPEAIELHNKAMNLRKDIRNTMTVTVLSSLLMIGILIKQMTLVWAVLSVVFIAFVAFVKITSYRDKANDYDAKARDRQIVSEKFSQV